MDRRTFAGAVTAGVLITSLDGAAQLTRRVPKVGVLTLSVAPSMAAFRGFQQGLRDLGYVEGQNIILELRFAQGRPERLSAMAAELVEMKADIIVTESNLAAQAAKDVSGNIPIVMAVTGDPVGAGLVASLSRPGGTITGLSVLAQELSGKRLQLLRDVAPNAVQVAVIWNAAYPAAAGYLAETRAAARSMSLGLQSFEVRSASDLDIALRSIATARPTALITLPDGMLLANRARIVELTLKSRLPAVFPDREFAEAGGLLAYGPSLTANFRGAATYVDKILKGSPGRATNRATLKIRAGDQSEHREGAQPYSSAVLTDARG
jgi:putative tryptophan/tyrosine transport system substrate-binding protein